MPFARLRHRSQNWKVREVPRSIALGCPAGARHGDAQACSAGSTACEATFKSLSACCRECAGLRGAVRCRGADHARDVHLRLHSSVPKVDKPHKMTSAQFRMFQGNCIRPRRPAPAAAPRSSFATAAAMPRKTLRSGKQRARDAWAMTERGQKQWVCQSRLVSRPLAHNLGHLHA
jgi:hypothetical protein